MRLIDCLINWDALCARVPPSQWRTDDGPTAAPVCNHRTCGYAGGRKCTHRDPDMVPDGVVFHRALVHTISDPHAVVALKADIERQLSRLPKLPRALFRLIYQSGRRNLTLDQARQALKIASLRDVAACHGLWMARMEAALSDWFPRGGRDAG